ncbi:hypothetical protein M514_05595 [Trichuris suis]|uniref:Uncharacterized protein n=1 Tax=Trichuris suis TaxID=68888 RepID=A0A085NQU4_9BILA|nr:hypothetical protein M514_05595 [Trichuris suis]
MTSCHRPACENMFDMVRRCFQVSCTDELTIGDIIDKLKANAPQRDAKALWLTAESMHKFFIHLPENYELSGGISDTRNVVVRFRMLSNSAACTKSKRCCKTQTRVPANSRINVSAKTIKPKLSSGASLQLLNETCALIMNAFIALGRNDVSLLQLRKMLNNDDMPIEIRNFIFRDRSSLGTFLAEHPYLFVKTGNHCYSMLDERTASLLVNLNNVVWRSRSSMTITSLVSVASEIDSTLNNAQRLESLLARYTRLFTIESGTVTVRRRIDGFQRACELMERLG